MLHAFTRAGNSLSRRVAVLVCSLIFFSPLVIWAAATPPADVHVGIIKITTPNNSGNLVTGATFAILGNNSGARYHPEISTDPNAPAPPKWIVNCPKILLELDYTATPNDGDNGVTYLINSTTVPMTFPDDESPKGTFDGSLTASQQGGRPGPYQIFALGLDKFNNQTQSSDEIQVAIVDPSAPKP